MKHSAPPVNVATLTGRFSSLRAKQQSFGELMTCDRVSRLLHYALTPSVLRCVLCSDTNVQITYTIKKTYTPTFI